MGHLVIALWLSACAPPDTVEEACPARVRGESAATDGADVAILRASCHRRVVGFDSFQVSAPLQVATAGHTHWMAQNDVLTDVETAGTPGFVAATFEERLQRAGWTTPAFFWTLYDDALGTDAAVVIDDWLADPYRREALLQPDAVYAGFALVGGFGHWTSAFAFPTRSAGYVVYPRDGQRDVPTTWDSAGYVGDDVSDGDVGFPITITVGATEANTDATGAFVANPYDFAVDNVVLSGPNGPVSTVVVTPDNPPQNGNLVATIAVIPRDPLERGETWIFQADITWLGGEAAVSVTFVTAD